MLNTTEFEQLWIDTCRDWNAGSELVLLSNFDKFVPPGIWAISPERLMSLAILLPFDKLTNSRWFFNIDRILNQIHIGAHQYYANIANNEYHTWIRSFLTLIITDSYATCAKSYSRVDNTDKLIGSSLWHRYTIEIRDYLHSPTQYQEYLVVRLATKTRNIWSMLDIADENNDWTSGLKILYPEHISILDVLHSTYPEHNSVGAREFARILRMEEDSSAELPLL